MARQRKQKQSCNPRYRERVLKLANVISAAMEAGEVRQADPYKLALFIIEGSTAIILDRLSGEPDGETTADVDMIAGLILDGIRKRS